MICFSSFPPRCPQPFEGIERLTQEHYLCTSAFILANPLRLRLPPVSGQIITPLFNVATLHSPTLQS